MAERPSPEFESHRRRLTQSVQELAHALGRMAVVMQQSGTSIFNLSLAMRTSDTDRVKVFEVYSRALIENIRQRAKRPLR